MIRSGDLHEASDWIARGIAGTQAKLPGIAAELRKTQCELWEKEGDWLRVAAVRAEEFLDMPAFLSYRRLEDAARASGIWDEMKGVVRQFLVTGKIPGERRGGQDNEGKLFGVLPCSGLFPQGSKRKHGSPFPGILIDIAIAENKPDEVLIWYDTIRGMSGTWGRFDPPDDKVANCIAEQFPDRALTIWMEKAEKYAAESRPKSYEAAVGYLGKIGALMKDQGREAEWDDYMTRTRNTNARKKRFLEMLDVLEGKKILDS